MSTHFDPFLRAMLMALDAAMLRGDNARRLQLPDLFIKHVLPLSKVDCCFTLGAVIDQGKTNQLSPAISPSLPF